METHQIEPTEFNVIKSLIHQRLSEAQSKGFNPTHLLLGPYAAQAMLHYLSDKHWSIPIPSHLAGTLRGVSFAGLEIIETLEDRVSVALIP
jgi:hypothetical protein